MSVYMGGKYEYVIVESVDDAKDEVSKGFDLHTKYSVIIVMFEYGSGYVDGYWICDHHGSPQTVKLLMAGINDCNGDKYALVAVKQIASTTPALNLWRHLRPLVRL